MDNQENLGEILKQKLKDAKKPYKMAYKRYKKAMDEYGAYLDTLSNEIDTKKTAKKIIKKADISSN